MFSTAKFNFALGLNLFIYDLSFNGESCLCAAMGFYACIALPCLRRGSQMLYLFGFVDLL